MEIRKMNHSIADAGQREQALNPELSFIVQAPAGSGKTELLIQRYLKLLSVAESPEEIIAITFTRKAAAEMRNRIQKALDRGLNDSPPEQSHEYATWELSRAVLKQNDKHQWMLTQNPIRFKIQTIDSLCAQLTRQMPMLSGFGGQPEITEKPQALYQKAARNAIADLESGSSWSRSVEALIRHLDNHLEKVEGLIAGMLAKRDQWLRHVAGRHQREILENSLVNMVKDALSSVRRLFPASGLQDLLDLSGFAAGNLKAWGSCSPILELDGLNDLPGASPEDRLKWLGICDLLLTQEGKWRKTVTKNMGFPAPSNAKAGSELKVLYQEKKSFSLITSIDLSEMNPWPPRFTTSAACRMPDIRMRNGISWRRYLKSFAWPPAILSACSANPARWILPKSRCGRKMRWGSLKPRRI